MNRYLSILIVTTLVCGSAWAKSDKYLFHDSHLHLTNYIQEGITPQQMLLLMGDKVGRVTLFGIPLQQQWSHRVSGSSMGPTYYLQTDAPLYYYSFTDAVTAMTFRSLTKAQQDRFDPMITGFNPTDMYAADHIRRVLETFPGVFSGIGEFTIHKEFVSSKVSGEVASLNDPALDRVLGFAAETGLIAILHNDIDTPFPKASEEPSYLQQMKELFGRNSKTKIIWAHMGVGRVVRPVQNHLSAIEAIIKNSRFTNIYFDISWMETAKYIVASPQITQMTADLMNKYPDRFLFGTDEVAPKDQKSYMSVYEAYQPLWTLLSEDASEKIRKGNYVRLFDEAKKKVRAWEKANISTKVQRVSQVRTTQ